MVRLITHNLLACHAKGCTTNNFPLKLSDVKLALREADFNPDFLRGFLPRIEWNALIQASREVTNLVLFSFPYPSRGFFFMRSATPRFPRSNQKCSTMTF